jgi:hypothetical protein
MIFVKSEAMNEILTRRWLFCLLAAVALSGCAGTSGGERYDPLRCDRNGDESQRRSC